MVTSAREWRARAKRLREGGEEITLPSGLTARVRNVPVGLFALHGNIPDSLSPIIAEMIGGSPQSVVQHNPMLLLQAQYSLMNQVAKFAFVSPRIVDEPQGDDEIHIDDVDDDDKAALMGLLGLPAQQLATFCAQQSASVESVRVGGEITEETA